MQEEKQTLCCSFSTSVYRATAGPVFYETTRNVLSEEYSADDAIRDAQAPEFSKVFTSCIIMEVKTSKNSFSAQSLNHGAADESN